MNGNGPMDVTDKLTQYRVLDTTLLGLLICVRGYIRDGQTPEEAVENVINDFRENLRAMVERRAYEDLGKLGRMLEASRAERALDAVLSEAGYEELEVQL